MPFSPFSGNDLKEKFKGIFGTCITGEKMQMCRVRLTPGVSTDHSHLQEQMGYILSGKAEITIGDEKKVCGSEEAYHIPGNVPHGFKTLGDEDVEYIEIFSPPKQENARID